VSSAAPQIQVLIVDDTRAHVDQVSQILSREVDLHVQTAPNDIAQALKAVAKDAPDIILLAARRDDPIDVIRRFDAAAPTAAIIALLADDQESLGRDATLAGARAYITHIYNRNDLVETVRRVHEIERRRRMMISQAGLMPLPQTGRVISVHGAKGGVGATTIAVNLAVAMRTMTNGRVALVDGNLYSGDVAVSLNIISRNSLADLLPHLRDLDKDVLDSASVVHRSGVAVLLAPDDLESAEIVSGEAMQRVLRSMRAYFDYVIVDTCSLPDQVTATALDSSDTIILVATPELPALKNAARFVRTCRDYGYPADKLLLLINRENSRGAITRGDIEDNLKLKVAVGIRSDGKTLIKAINAGEPAVTIDRRSRLSRGVRELVQILTSDRPLTATGPSSNGSRNGHHRGLLNWLPRRP
jgi:pilus assembly protein CpaE